MAEKKRCIYLHRNKINGKVYIGQTVCQDNLTRRTHTDGSGYKNERSKFWRAIQKYGWDNIKHTLILDNLTHKEACEMERKLIKN